MNLTHPHRDSPTERYRLRAYVCRCGDVRVAADMGVTTLADVFQRRPDGCQFGIVSRLATSCTAERSIDYLVIDLYALRTLTGREVLLGDHKVFPTYEAAVAAAQLML